MSLKEVQAKIQWAGEEAWLEGNVDALNEAYAEDYVSHRPPFPDVEGLEAAKQSIAATRLAYSDIEATYDEWIAEGDAIAYRYTMRIKHTGTSPSLPIPPTSKEVALQGCILVHVKDGKVVEEWEYSDYLGFLQQLGMVPPLGWVWTDRASLPKLWSRNATLVAAKQFRGFKAGRHTWLEGRTCRVGVRSYPIREEVGL